MKMLLGILLLTSVSSFASDKGNGGGLHFCPNGKTEMYDLYEGYTRYDLSPTRNRKTTTEYIKKAVAKLKRYYLGFGKEVELVVKYLVDDKNLLLRSNLQMELIDDANLLVIGEGCEYRQLANWDNKSNKVLVKKEYFDRLDAVNQAALYLHEAIYLVLRNRFNETNSDNARRTVAEAMDDSAHFSYVFKWESSYNEPQIFTKPMPMRLSVTGNETDHRVKLHLGDEDFHDKTKNIRLLVSMDLTKPKQVRADIENEIKEKKDETKSLKDLMSKTRSRTKREELDWEIKALESKVWNLEDELKDVTEVINAYGSFNSVVRKKGAILFPRSFSRFIRDEAMIVDITYTAMIDDLVIGQEIARFRLPRHLGYARENASLYLYISQNVKH